MALARLYWCRENIPSLTIFMLNNQDISLNLCCTTPALSQYSLLSFSLIHVSCRWSGPGKKSHLVFVSELSREVGFLRSVHNSKRGRKKHKKSIINFSRLQLGRKKVWAVIIISEYRALTVTRNQKVKLPSRVKNPLAENNRIFLRKKNWKKILWKIQWMKNPKKISEREIPCQEK